MPVSSGSVMARSAAHLNDPSQLVYTPTVLLPFLGAAVDELGEEMAVYELAPLIKDDVEILVASGDTILALPSDFVEPINLFERSQGSNNEWIEVRENDYIDPYLFTTPSELISQWAVRNLTILINPPTIAREVKLTYLRGLIDPTLNNNVDIDITRNFLALLTARNAAADAGNSMTKANSYEKRIDRSRDRVITRLHKANQSIKGVRRLPYRGKG